MSGEGIARGGGRLNALTGLRAVAAGMILVHHAVYLHMSPPHWQLENAVSLFFVLSGFILAWSHPRIDSWENARTFLVLRIGRIWPAHVAGLALAIAFAAPLTVDLPLFANLAMLQGWIPTQSFFFSYNAPSWSISTELFFYLAFPFLIFAWRRTWWIKLLGAAALAALMVEIGKWLALPEFAAGDTLSLHGLLYINPLARILEFVTGMVACSVFRWMLPRAAQLGLLGATVLEVAVVALTTYFMVNYTTMWLADRYLGAGPVWNAWLAYAGMLPIFPMVIIVLGLGRGLLSRLLASRPAIFLGEISYSVYLVHVSVYVFYARHFMPSESAPGPIGLAICIVVSLGIATLIWRFIETPARRAVRRHVVERRTVAPAAAVA